MDSTSSWRYRRRLHLSSSRRLRPGAFCIAKGWRRLSLEEEDRRRRCIGRSQSAGGGYVAKAGVRSLRIEAFEYQASFAD